MSKGLFKAIVVGVGLILSLGGLVLFSSFPLRLYSESLSQKGIKVQGLRGNLAQGIEVDSISGSVASSEFEVKNLRFTYSGLLTLPLHHKLVISEINADRILVKLKTPSSPEEDASKPQTPESKSRIRDIVGKFLGFLIREFHIERARITNAEVVHPLQDRLPSKIKEILLVGLSTDFKNTSRPSKFTIEPLLRERLFEPRSGR